MLNMQIFNQMAMNFTPLNNEECGIYCEGSLPAAYDPLLGVAILLGGSFVAAILALYLYGRYIKTNRMQERMSSNVLVFISSIFFYVGALFATGFMHGLLFADNSSVNSISLLASVACFGIGAVLFFHAADSSTLFTKTIAVSVALLGLVFIMTNIYHYQPALSNSADMSSRDHCGVRGCLPERELPGGALEWEFVAGVIIIAVVLYAGGAVFAHRLEHPKR